MLVESLRSGAGALRVLPVPRVSALWELFGSSQAQFRSSPGAVWEQFAISQLHFRSSREQSGGLGGLSGHFETSSGALPEHCGSTAGSLREH